MTTKLCKECSNMINSKPMARCKASKYQDPVTGDDKRLCFVERLDGIGRCGIMANNYSPVTVTPKVRKDPAVKVTK